MGEVWKARDTQLDRDVALKVSKDAFTARFDREARAIAAFNHPNICQIYDVGPNYLVMELIDGVPLKGPLPVEKAVAYAGLILDALDAAHRKGFTHRDLKPANVLTTKQGLKLLDFGLAKQRAATLGPDDVTGSPMTKDGRITGTLQYMSPEQLQGKEADARSDIFAFGCVLYEMLSGRKAFSGSTTASVIAAIMEREPEPLQTTPPLDRVIRTCLCKDPDERFQSARDVKKALLWAAESAPGVLPIKVRAPWIFAAAMGLIAGSALLYSFGVARRPAAPPVNAVPVVVLMDTSAPEGVYDPETRKKSGTNADDISDALNNLPVAIHKETVGSTWNREDQVLKQIPDLIVIHRSAFIHAIVLDFELGYPALAIPTARRSQRQARHLPARSCTIASPQLGRTNWKHSSGMPPGSIREPGSSFIREGGWTRPGLRGSRIWSGDFPR
jgi:hypothetical protein